MNSVQIIGVLAKAPVKITFPSGKFLVGMEVGTSKTYKNSHGKIVHETIWHHVQAFKELGEMALEELKEMDQIHVRGSLSHIFFNGCKSTVIIADSIEKTGIK